MKQVLIQKGQVLVVDVPAPCVEPGKVLVQVDHSCISVGTEMSGVKASGVPLWKRALTEPENVKKAVQMISKDGIQRAQNQIRNRISAVRPSGYSAAGVVLEVGVGVDGLTAGERVACAGSESAFHAEVICVPRNLVARVPDEVNLAEASTVTLGAIALQGVRRAQPTLGETFVVIGLGMLGQLTVQLLKANGCKAIGTDVDSARIDHALALGMDGGLYPDDPNAVARVAQLTDGFGADGAIITAATQSDEVVSMAFQVCRKKGRVVLVGDVGLNLDRQDLYLKELDFLVSTSYGPGRYDRRYEDEGLDYPLAYVRWTENRNMVEYLRLLSANKVQIDHCIDSVYPLADAANAFDALSNREQRPLMVLLSYPDRTPDRAPRRRIDNPKARASDPRRIRLAVVGAGAYAKQMHLPIIQALSDHFHLQAIVSRTGHKAKETAGQFGASYSTTDYESILRDPEVDAVLISTRHDLHASMTVQALNAGKHVLVEKPLALKSDELARVEGFYSGRRETETLPVLMTGFNRRFSKHLRHAGELVRERTNPLMVNYQMNAGYIPLDHWVHSNEGGGRNLGEACHVYDVFQYLIGEEVDSVSAVSIRPATGYYAANDNFVATLRYRDGSVATLTYTALGATDYPKERVEIFSDGSVISMDDYAATRVVGPGGRRSERKGADKGQKNELIAFADVIQNGGDWPMSLSDQLSVTRTAILVERQLQSASKEET